jgi:hypothetical protein
MRMTKDLLAVTIILILLAGSFLFYEIRAFITAIKADLVHILYSVNSPIYDQIDFFFTNLIFISTFIISFCLFTLKPLFRKLIIVAISADIVYSIFFTQFSPENLLSQALSVSFDVALSACLIWFFSSKRIKSQFVKI